MFFLGTVVGAFVAVLLGLVTLDFPAGTDLAVWQDWMGIANAPVTPPPTRCVVLNPVEHANDFYRLSKVNFSAPASPPSFDSPIPLRNPAFDSPPPPTTAGFFDKVFDILCWFLVVLVTRGLAFLPIAYVTARSLRDRRTKDLRSLASGLDEARLAFVLDVQSWGEILNANREGVQLERSAQEASVLQLEQVTLALEKGIKDKIRRFRESEAEKGALMRAVRSLKSELLLLTESTERRQSTAIKAVEEAMGRRMEGLEAEKRMMEEELAAEVESAAEERGRAREMRRTAEEDFERVMDAAAEQLAQAKRATEEAKEKAEEEKEKAEKEVAGLKSAWKVQEAAMQAKIAWYETRDRQAKYGTGRPQQPYQQHQQQPFQQLPPPQQPFQPFGQRPQPPPGGR